MRAGLFATLALWAGVALTTLLFIAALLVLRPDSDFRAVRAAYAGADSRFIKLPDGAVAHLRDGGEEGATPIVMLHGFASSAWAWDGWSDMLGHDYRTIRIDLLGHGLTRAAKGAGMARADQAAFVLATLDAIGVKRFVLAGNSMGGGVAQAIAAAHPDRVRALILVDSAGPSDGPPERVRRMTQQWYAPLLRFAFRWAGGDLIMRQSMKSGVADGSKIRDEDVRRTDFFWRLHRGELIAAMEGRGGSVSLADIKAPTLVMQGGADKLVARATAEKLAGEIRDARLVLYPALGHTPHQEDPAATTLDVRTFLAAKLKASR